MGKKQRVRQGTCGLCERARVLQGSHIVPKFVWKWIISSSLTGYLRAAAKPNVRRQDGDKQYLLCFACEQLLARDEGWFSQAIFRPVVQGTGRRVVIRDVDGHVLRFATGLALRVALFRRSTLPESGEHREQLNVQIAKWRQYLLEGAGGAGSHYLFVLPEVERRAGGDDVLFGINWYLWRTVQSALVYSQSEIFVLTKLPGIALVSAVGPQDLAGLKSQQVEHAWEFDSASAMLEDPRLVRVLMEDARRAIVDLSALSAVQEERVAADAEAALARGFAPPGLRAVLLDLSLAKPKM